MIVVKGEEGMVYCEECYEETQFLIELFVDFTRDMEFYICEKCLLEALEGIKKERLRDDKNN